MIPPASVTESIFFRWIRLRGFSRGIRTNLRRSLSITSDALVIKFEEFPLAILERVFIEQGVTSMPLVWKDPLAIVAPIFRLSWTSSARPVTSLKE